jgi:RimK family alpha-L-glutamate ligase
VRVVEPSALAFFLVAGRLTETNAALISALRGAGLAAELLRPPAASRQLQAGDVALGRVDILPTLDGVESCLWQLRRLEGRGVQILNGVGALLAAHDKLTTALRLHRAGLPHPRTVHIDERSADATLDPPVVVKPRFGSWGRDVVLCETRASLDRALRRLRRRRWFRTQGVLVQELVPPCRSDLRLVVAGGRVVGAVERQAAPGEWRTNVALGARRVPVDPPSEARALAVAASAAVGGDLVGVDLLPHGDSYVVLELNGAVDFTADYSLEGRDVFAEAARALTESIDGAAPARDQCMATG